MQLPFHTEDLKHQEVKLHDRSQKAALCQRRDLNPDTAALESVF